MLTAREAAREDAYDNGRDLANDIEATSADARSAVLHMYRLDPQLQRDFLDGFETARDAS